MADPWENYGQSRIGSWDDDDDDDDDDRKYVPPPYVTHNYPDDKGCSSVGGSNTSRVDAIPHGSWTNSQLRARQNPFGDARPREFVLQDRGKDPFRLEEPAVDRPLTVEESLIMDEIAKLKEQLLKEIEHGKFPGGIEDTLREMISEKELKLQNLRNRLRYGYK